MKISPAISRRTRAAYALLLVLVLLAIALVILGATMSRTMTSSKLNDRNNLYTLTGAAAEAATEKVLTRMLVDYQIDSEARVITNLNLYRGSIPSSAENSYWTNFEFSDGQGHVGSNYVARITTNANPVYTALQSQFAGLYGFSSTYRIISNVRPLNSMYTFTNAVQQDIQMAEIPVFQFAIFYNSLLEFTWAATLVVRGRVHCNTNIYIGSSSDLSFSNIVTTSGNITWPAWDGHTTNQYTGHTNWYQPTNGYSTGQPALTLPIGTNNSPGAVHAIIDPPPAGEDVNSAMGLQRFYNKAGMTIMVSNSSVTINLKSLPTDAGITISNNWTNATTGVNKWLSTNAAFFDYRENTKTALVAQVDVGKLASWITTNTSVIAKFPSGSPLDIIYVADYRTSSSKILRGVRLVNGTTLPTNGLTVATPGPLYIDGNYNCPNSSFLGTTNTTASVPASVVSDALTILSPSWSDTSTTNSLSSRSAGDTTVNTAIITGVVYSTDSTATGFSGGVVNMPRLLENWTGNTLTLNTSMVNLFYSTWATNQFQNPGVYYNAPTRNFNFDQNYTQAAKLPPGTPQMHQMVRAVWCNPPPNNVTTSNVWIYNGD